LRILAVNQFYSPDMSATSQLLSQLCHDLASQGHEVSVIASRGKYLGGKRLPAREQLDGVTVLRPWATSFGKGSIAHRMADYLSFWASAVTAAARSERPDVILALTTPPMIASGAAAVAKLRKIPLVCWVQDVYPEVAIEFGLFGKEHPAAALFGALARATHRAASGSVALSEGMAKRLMDQGQISEKIHIIPNWSDGESLKPLAHDHNPFRQAHNLQDRFVVMYSGNLGVGHDVETLVEAAKQLAQRQPQVSLVFVGEGARKKEAQELAQGMKNVEFFPYQPFEKLSESLSAADVHLASLRPGLAGLLVPSKLYGVLAAGRPLLYIGPADCELSRVIDKHRIGWAGRSGDATGLASAIERLVANPNQTQQMGSRARAIFETEFDRPHAVRRWRDVLEKAATQ
jgi:colanic acid biosynthesis glycosyl transferase WcaI